MEKVSNLESWTMGWEIDDFRRRVSVTQETKSKVLSKFYLLEFSNPPSTRSTRT